MPRARRWLAPVVVVVATLALLSLRLGHPRVQTFDEIYYANDALDLLTHGAERGFAVHPPLGKWIVAAGMRVFGFTPVGWRAGSVVAGTVTVLLTWWVALRCSGSRLLAALAAALTATDAIFFWSARLAMLDVFVALFSVALVAVLVARWRVWPTALAGGLALGAAVACKWSALPLAVVLVVVLVVRTPGWRRRAAAVVVALAVAALAYVGSYSAWVVGGGAFGDCGGRCPTTVAGRLAALPAVTGRMARYDGDLKRVNVYLAPGWEWLDQGSPTVLYREACRGQVDAVCGPGDRGLRQIVDRGDVVLWLTAIPAALVAVWRRRPEDGDRADRGSVAVVVGAAVALYAPWVAYPKTFSFYAAPIVPLLAVTAAVALGRLAPDRRVRAAVAVLVVVAAAGQLAGQLAAGRLL